MPTRRNRGFYWRSYCLPNMFWAPLCPSLAAQDYYTVVCCLWYFVLWFSSCWSGVELWVVCLVCGMLRAPLCPSSGAQEYYTVVAACGISCCGFQVVGLARSCGLCVRFAGCCGHHYAHHQELKSIIQWLLPVVFRAVVFKLLVWCGAEGYVSGLQDAAASCKPDT